MVAAVMVITSTAAAKEEDTPQTNTAVGAGTENKAAATRTELRNPQVLHELVAMVVSGGPPAMMTPLMTTETNSSGVPANESNKGSNNQVRRAIPTAVKTSQVRILATVLMEIVS